MMRGNQPNHMRTLSAACGLFVLIGWHSVAMLSAQSGNSIPTPKPIDPASNSTNPSASAVQSQNPFLGSVPVVDWTPGVRPLSLQDAVQLALKSNLGLTDAKVEERTLSGERLRAVSALLPHLDGSLSTHMTQLNGTEASGGKKLSLPNVIGPYSYQAAHLNLEEKALDLHAMHQIRSAQAQYQAATLSAADSRNIVVLAAASGYVAIAATESRVNSYQAELESNKALEALMQDRVAHGVSPNIDLIRAQVASRTAAQRLALARIQLEKDKYALARVIGLPVAQQFSLTTPLDFADAPDVALDQLLQEAATSRRDLMAAHKSFDAALEATRAAVDQRMPTFAIHANVGAAGVNSARLYGTYDVGASLSVPVFTGGEIRSAVQIAKALEIRRHAELADIEERVRFDVRSAYLDLQGAAASVAVANENLKLARQGAKEARDRFDVGVATSIDVLGAEDELAAAEDNYISSVHAHNLAKLLLIRATGEAEIKLASYLGEK